MKEKIMAFQKKLPGFNTLLYINVALPALLYLLALVAGSSMAKFFHTYALYILSTIPNFRTFTGCVGALISLYFVLSALFRKRYADAICCFLLTLFVTVFFLTGLNYQILKPLSF